MMDGDLEEMVTKNIGEVLFALIKSGNRTRDAVEKLIKEHNSNLIIVKDMQRAIIKLQLKIGELVDEE